MAVYLFISYPLHSLLKTHSSGINYLHWSSIGNLIFTSSLLAYFMSLNSTLKYKSKSNFSNAMLVSPQPNSRHLIAIVIWSSAVAFIQLLFSVGITQSLNSSLSTTNILWVILYLIPIIIMTSNIGGDLESKFLEVANKCEAVLCCRMSPLQKAHVVKIVKRR